MSDLCKSSGQSPGHEKTTEEFTEELVQNSILSSTVLTEKNREIVQSIATHYFTKGYLTKKQLKLLYGFNQVANLTKIAIEKMVLP